MGLAVMDGVEMLAWLCQKTPEQIKALGLTDKQLEKIGQWMMDNGRLQMLSPHYEEKTAVIVCKCGCGESFTATYTTRPPLYMNRAHRMRAYRKRRKEREPGWTS